MFYKKIIQSLILSIFILLGGLSVFAQEELGSYVIKTETGYLLVQNREKVSFSLEFKGEKLKPLKSDHPTFVLDGKLIQVVTVENKYYWGSKGDSKTEPTIEQFLEAHKVWESDYLGNALKSKLSVSSEFVEFSQKRKAMFWSFPMPENLNSDYSHQLFLTTLIGKDVVGINASADTADDQKPYRSYILETMNSLKTSDKPFNINEIKTFLKKGESAE